MEIARSVGLHRSRGMMAEAEVVFVKYKRLSQRLAELPLIQPRLSNLTSAGATGQIRERFWCSFPFYMFLATFHFLVFLVQLFLFLYLFAGLSCTCLRACRAPVCVPVVHLFTCLSCTCLRGCCAPVYVPVVHLFTWLSKPNCVQAPSTPPNCNDLHSASLVTSQVIAMISTVRHLSVAR
jgi:hypothetical protein